MVSLLRLQLLLSLLWLGADGWCLRGWFSSPCSGCSSASRSHGSVDHRSAVVRVTGCRKRSRLAESL